MVCVESLEAPMHLQGVSVLALLILPVLPALPAPLACSALPWAQGLVEGDGLRRPAWLNLSVHLFNSVVAWLDLLIGVCVEAGRAVCVMQGGGGGALGRVQLVMANKW